MKRIQRDTLLGIVFFGTMSLLLIATLTLTDISLGDVQELEVWFEDAGGIRVGDPVLLLGKRVGKVTAIDYRGERPDNPMQLLLRIDEPVPLTADKVIEIQDAGVLGGKQVYINPGRGAPLPPDALLTGRTSGNPLDAARQFFDGSGPTGRELLGLLQDVRAFFQNLNDPDTSSIGAIVNRRELYDEVLGSVQILRRLFQAVEDGEGALGRIVKDTALRDDVLRAVANFARMSEQLNTTESAIGRLLNDRELADRLATIALKIEAIVTRINEGRGLAGRIINDEELADTLAGAVTSLASILTKADNPEAGTLGALLADLEMRQDIKELAANLSSVSEKLDEGKGMLGLLINDEDMGLRLRRILNQVSRALEDAREAAPIGTFIQVLFGAF